MGNDLSYGFTSYSRFGGARLRPYSALGGAVSDYKAPALVKRIPLTQGDIGVEQTITEMRRMVVESGADPRWHDIAVWLVPEGPHLLGEAAYRQLFGGLRRTYRFVRDARYAEQLWEPVCHANRLQTLGYTWGDCDDASIYAACVASSINLGPLRFRTIANGKQGNTLNHVFTEVCINGMWRTLDFMSPGQKEVRARVWMI